jgi:hypothetical protein
MNFLSRLVGKKQPATSSGNQASSAVDPPAPPTVIAKATEHYVLKCMDCGFELHIPGATTLPSVAFSVDVSKVRMTCVYGGGAFTVTLGVHEFFTIATVPESGRVLHASIVDNIKPLHEHMLSHCDPLFLVIQQSRNQTTHEYKKQPEGDTYVKFSRTQGVDIVGNIDVSKAEIPGVS